jgi:hypothetical protein
MGKTTRILSVSVLALTIGLAASGCGASDKPVAADPAATAAVVNAASADDAKNAAGAKAVMDAFLAAALKDGTKGATAAEPGAELRPAPSTPAEKAESLKVGFPTAIPYVDTTKLSVEKQEEMFTGFAVVSIFAGNAASLTTTEAGFTLDGDTATTQGSTWEFTVGGNKQPMASSTSEVTLTYGGGKWLISDYSAPQAESMPAEVTTSEGSGSWTVEGGANVTSGGGTVTTEITTDDTQK